MKKLERTLSFLKPQVFHNNLVGKIISELEKLKDKKGITIVECKMFKFTDEILTSFYDNISKENFFDSYKLSLQEGPCLLIVFEGFNAIKELRKKQGKTDPKDAAKNSIRGKFGISKSNNLLHCSDSKASFKKEYELLKEL